MILYKNHIIFLDFIINKMSRISFCIDSIELEESTLKNININNLIGLRLTQKPQNISDEYIIGNKQSLQSTSQEFYIEDHFNELDKIILMIRTVQSCYSTSENKKECFSEKGNENCDENSIKENIEKKLTKNSNIIGNCTIDMKKMKEGSNNTFSAEIISKSDGKVIGQANLEIYIRNISSRVNKGQRINEPNKETIITKNTIKPRKMNHPFVL